MTATSDSAAEVSFDQVKRRLRLDWDTGEHIQIPFIWLRHTCFFPLMGRPEQIDPREHLLPEEPSELQIETARVSAGELIVEWRRGQGGNAPSDGLRRMVARSARHEANFSQREIFRQLQQHQECWTGVDFRDSR